MHFLQASIWLVLDPGASAVLSVCTGTISTIHDAAPPHPTSPARVCWRPKGFPPPLLLFYPPPPPAPLPPMRRRSAVTIGELERERVLEAVKLVRRGWSIRIAMDDVKQNVDSVVRASVGSIYGRCTPQFCRRREWAAPQTCRRSRSKSCRTPSRPSSCGGSTSPSFTSARPCRTLSPTCPRRRKSSGPPGGRLSPGCGACASDGTSSCV